MAAPLSWNELPDIALIYIYSTLADHDRLSVACTCKNWCRLFDTAVLWRNRKIVFDNRSAELIAETEVKFLDRFGHCLNKLCINFGQPTFKSCMAISKAADSFMKRVGDRNDIRLKELDIESLHMEQHWHFILSRNRLVTALSKMIRKQRYLELVFMAGARMRLVDGCRVLEALTKGLTSKTIKTIYMEDFFETNMFPFRHARYVSAISKFTSLEHVHINYRYLNGDIIRNMANRLSHSLVHISVILDGDVRGIEIGTEVWLDFASKVPKAELGVYLCTTILRGNDLRTPFVMGMPVNNIYLTSWARIDETERRLSGLLRHIGCLFHRTLETFAMFFEHHEKIDAELVLMIRRCKNIKDLSVQAKLSSDTVVEIMQLHFQKVITLKSVNLTIKDMADEEWPRIDEARDRFLADVSEFVYIGPTELDSSIGEDTISTASANDADDEAIVGENNILRLASPHASDDEDNDLFRLPAIDIVDIGRLFDRDEFEADDDDDFPIL